jgi:hypothetical protein
VLSTHRLKERLFLVKIISVAVVVIVLASAIPSFSQNAPRRPNVGFQAPTPSPVTPPAVAAQTPGTASKITSSQPKVTGIPSAQTSNPNTGTTPSAEVLSERMEKINAQRQVFYDRLDQLAEFKAWIDLTNQLTQVQQQLDSIRNSQAANVNAAAAAAAQAKKDSASPK